VVAWETVLTQAKSLWHWLGIVDSSKKGVAAPIFLS
jgi:hypothetical protein